MYVVYHGVGHVFWRDMHVVYSGVVCVSWYGCMWCILVWYIHGVVCVDHVWYVVYHGVVWDVCSVYISWCNVSYVCVYPGVGCVVGILCV